MQVRRTRGASHQRSGAMCLAALVIAGTLALAGCGQSARPKAARATDCGTSHTAANVPVEVAVERGQVACATALAVESDYAKAIVQGKAPGNGGGGPVTVNGWTCQGFPTPELLRTGDTSKCVKDGTEIMAVLKTPA
jgi:hypothetical protein